MKKNIGLLLSIIITHVCGQLVSTPLYFNSRASNIFIKKLLLDFMTHSFNKYIDHKFQITTDSIPLLKQLNIKNNNKVDILISNHFSSIDFMLLFYLLNCVERRDIIIVLKKGMLLYPSINITVTPNTFIKLNRNWENDKDILQTAIKKIKSGIIIMFPEGTRINKNNYIKSVKYCKENNIIPNKKLLIPKVKGLFNIVTILKKNNSYGNLFDVTSVVPEITTNYTQHNYDLMRLFTTDISESYHFIRKLDLPNYYDDYHVFKNWIYHQWNTKDFIISNYKTYNYKQLKGRTQQKNITTCYILLIVYFYLLKKYPYHVASLFGVSYILPAIEYFRL
tara:strand:- start:1345 stop:2352 length:1008 start_codon:yes stop_codon:yes gene_type:complete